MVPLIVLVAPNEEVVANNAEAREHVRCVLRVRFQQLSQVAEQAALSWHRDRAFLARGVPLMLFQAARFLRSFFLPLFFSWLLLALLASISAFGLHPSFK